MLRVCIGIPPLDEYPHAAVTAGMKRLGYECVPASVLADADMLIVWSPWNGSHRQLLQRHFEGQGKPVFVMENGWLSPIGRTEYFQLARGGWNGTGQAPPGDAARWDGFGVALRPWREENSGSYDLIIGQRGHPHDARTAPPDWHVNLRVANRQTILRARNSGRSLTLDLAAATVCHVWSSNAASHAIAIGVPVIQHGPNLAVSALASRPGEPLFRGDRAPELIRLSGAQWMAAELETGAPFDRLLRG